MAPLLHNIVRTEPIVALEFKKKLITGPSNKIIIFHQKSKKKKKKDAIYSRRFGLKEINAELASEWMEKKNKQIAWYILPSVLLCFLHYFDCVLTRLEKYQIHMLSSWFFIQFLPKRKEKKKENTKYTFVIKKKKKKKLVVVLASSYIQEKKNWNNKIRNESRSLSPDPDLLARPFHRHKKAPANYWSANADTTTTCPWRGIKKFPRT